MRAVEPRERGHVPGRPDADYRYPGPTARQYRFRRVTVIAMVLALVELVTLVAGCLSRPAAADQNGHGHHPAAPAGRRVRGELRPVARVHLRPAASRIAAAAVRHR